MMKMKQLVMAGTAIVMCLGATQIVAQDNSADSGKSGRSGRGNFDPSQFRERMMEGFKERLEIKDDADWKALQPLIEKVMDAQRAVISDRIRGAFGRGGRPPGGDNNGSGDQGGRRSSRGGFGGEPSAEAEALQKAIDGKAPNSELKAAIAKFVESRKDKQAELEKAQAELRKVLSVRQEAIATVSGLL
jgi:hypothetical protein